MAIESYEYWMNHQKPNEPMLPEGVTDRPDGKYYATCRSCEREYELCFDPMEFNEETNYCGGSPRCLP